MDAVLMLLLWLVILCAFGYVAHWGVTTFFPQPIQTPILIFVGVVFLILLIGLLIRAWPGRLALP